MTSNSPLKQEICIVANGPSVLEKKMGSLIDSFDTVARINNYSTNGFEEYTGIKTDIWFNGANSKLRKPGKQPDRCIVLIPSSVLKRKGKEIHKRIEKRTGRPKKDYLMVDVNEIMEFEGMCCNNRVTTGTMSVLWALKHYNTVYIHGFDFYFRDKSHYNDKSLIRLLVNSGIINKAGKHNTHLEKEVVESFILKGNVKPVSEIKKDS